MLKQYAVSSSRLQLCAGVLASKGFQAIHFSTRDGEVLRNNKRFMK